MQALLVLRYRGSKQQRRAVHFTTPLLLFVKSKFDLLKAQWLLYVPPGVTLRNSTFCPHSVFMCFVWTSEQTANISLYNTNWLVFITETDCVYCAVRTELLIYQGHLRFSPVNFIAPMPHIHCNVHRTLTRTDGESLGTLPKLMLFWKPWGRGGGGIGW
jgi:hypothetical protein